MKSEENKKNNSKALEDIVSRWRGCPYDFVVECLGACPTKQQEQVLRALAEEGVKISIRSGHGTGKSTIFSWVILWGLVCFYDCKIPVTAPTAHQLEDVIFPEVEKWRAQMLEPWRSSIKVKSDKIAMEGTPAFAAARTGRKENPEALQGFHADKLIFLLDEASGIDEVVFEAGRGALSTKGATLVMAANPTRLSGYFYNSHHRNRDLFTRFQFSCLDSPRVDKSYCEEIANEYGIDSDMYRVRVLGDFPSSSDLQFIPADLVEKAQGKELNATQYNFAPVIIGVDVAMYGGDRSAIFLRQGLKSELLWSGRNTAPEDLATRVCVYWDKHKADGVIVDATGVGEAVISSLHLMNRSPIAFYAAGKPTLENVANCRAEAWYKMRDWLKEGGCIPDNTDLRDDLVAPEFAYNLAGKIQLEKKSDMKKRGVNSPDLADALALTFGFNIIKRDDVAVCHVSATNKYDPFWRTKRG